MIPQLRFPEFTDQWEKVKLSDVAGRGKYGMNAAAKPYDGINKYLRITDIEDESRKILVDKVTSPSGTLDDSYLLKQDDIVLARTGASTGKSYIYQKSDGKVYFAGFLIRFRATKVNPYFAYSQTLRRPYDKWIAAISARSGQPGVNAEEYGTYSFYAPQRPEQEKIADFMGLADSKLNSIQAKVAAMHEYKKGVMQAIFSGKLRFKDENGNSYPDWEEKKLGDQLTEGSKIPVNDTAKYKKITIGLNKTGVRLAKISRKMSDTRPFYIRKSNEIIIGKQNYFNGSVAIVPKNLNDTICSNAIMSFSVNSTSSTKFIYEIISRNDFLKQRESLANGTGQKELSEKEFLNFKVSLPSLKEQQKIADFLSALDDKIKLEETKLASVKEFKKALLQRMFV